MVSISKWNDRNYDVNKIFWYNEYIIEKLLKYWLKLQSIEYKLICRFKEIDVDSFRIRYKLLIFYSFYLLFKSKTLRC